MEQQDLLHRAADVVTSSEDLARLLARVRSATAAVGDRLNGVRAESEDDRAALSLYARECAAAAAELLGASERLVASSRLTREARANLRKPATTSHEGRLDNQDCIEVSLEAVARSRVLLMRPVLRPETMPPWRSFKKERQPEVVQATLS
ncbi:hypothetical protein [Roseomonas elaeocarpi]|uniref:Uncharacterized protein n=1 Tax=Roseomonas elaeocarpi TaxID=907779 RepID=A0ABV6JPR3_9PROT